MKNSMVVTKNTLLIGKGLPPFESIKSEDVVPAITELLIELEQELINLEGTVKPTWNDLVEPLQKLEDRLTWSWGIVGHLMGVKNSPELRKAYNEIQPKVVEFINKLNQSQPIYQAFKNLSNSDSWENLDVGQKRIVEAAIKDAELSGVSLEGGKRENFNAIELELAELSNKFSNNVLDATKAFSLTLTKKEEVDSLPPSLLSLAAQAARDDGAENATAENGPWRITLDYPSFIPFMQHCKKRELREQLYKASISRASSEELNNYPLIQRILELRQEKTKILGFNSYAELSLATKMAPSVAAVEKLLEELRSVSYDAAVKELEELKQFAASKNAPEANDFKRWDMSFWSERLREEKFSFTVEELRPYFPLPQVLDGLFSLVKRIFGINITAVDGEAPLWHEDVRYFQISDETNTPIAYFYLDAYSRPAEKRGGAWMDECINRAKIVENGQKILRLPVAYLQCNQTPPVDGKPSLMSFSEVETLFHEFGHGLQHMLTTVDYGGAAGINNVEWDAVELPSQFMENWCYDRSTLFGMAKHYETGETLPEHYYQKLLAAKNYMSGGKIGRAHV